jgi:hypothetical protein
MHNANFGDSDVLYSVEIRQTLKVILYFRGKYVIVLDTNMPVVYLLKNLGAQNVHFIFVWNSHVLSV